MRIQTKRRIQHVGRVLFVCYLLVLLYLLFLSEGFGHRLSENREYRYNLVPFREIHRYWRYRFKLGKLAFLNLGGNILGFCPLGFMLPILNRRCRSVIRTVSMGCCLSLAVECVQLVFRLGSFDVDDILLNTLGTFLGVLAFRLSDFVRRWMYEKKV